MKKILTLAFIAFATPAFAVSNDDINRLFAHPPAAGGPDLNHLLATQAMPGPTDAVAQLASLEPSAAPTAPTAPVNTALTTTNPTPTAAPQAAIDPKNLQNMFQVSYSEAEEAVSAALGERGIADKVGAMMDGRKNTAIFAYSQPIHVQTRGMQVDKDHGRWSANILFVTADGSVVSALPAAGHFNEVIEVPVLKRAFRHGEVITQADIELRDFAMNRTRPDTVTDLSSLIGKTPMGSVSPFRPIRDIEIASMPIVKRDAIVQINYNVPGMQISTSGQALAAGARGDVIDVRNTTSKKVVRAVIEASDRVQVVTGTQTSQLTQ